MHTITYIYAHMYTDFICSHHHSMDGNHCLCIHICIYAYMHIFTHTYAHMFTGFICSHLHSMGVDNHKPCQTKPRCHF